MNERIKELYQKAHDVYQWDYPSSPVDPTVRSVHTSRQFNPEKFAELIIRECANVAADHEALDIYEEIREHFGVEERKGWICSKCGVDRTQAVCPKGHTAAITGDCPMTAEAQ